MANYSSYLMEYSIVTHILSLLFVVIVYFYYYSIKTFKFWKNKNVKFCHPTPFFGNTVPSMLRKKSNPLHQQDMYNTFPEEKYVGIYMFRTPVLMVRDPQLINSILSKDFNHFYDRGIVVDERLDLLSLHLVNLTGQKWKKLRSKLTPAFSSGKLKLMSNLLDDCCNSLSEYLQLSVENSNTCHDVRELMAKFATDVIGSCAFGMKFNSLQNPNSEFRKMGNEVFKPTLRFVWKIMARTIHPSLPYYLNLKLLRPEVENFFLDFVKNAVNLREQKYIEGERKDFLQLLINMRKEEESINNDDNGPNTLFLNDQILASNIFVFFLAGFETSSSTMSFLLLELAANPTIQETLRTEITQALEKHDGVLNYDTIKELPYMDKVIAETLRKYPIATILLRECTQTYQVPDESLVIEKGTKVLIPVYAIHHDPSYYENPDKFDPERFSTENKSKIVQGTYLPFGDGPRICIGIRFAMMEMKYAFCKIIPKYDFTLNERMSYPVKFKKGVPLLAPEDGIWLNVHMRA